MGGQPARPELMVATFLQDHAKPEALLWHPGSWWGPGVPRVALQGLSVLTTASCTGLSIVSSPTRCTLEGTPVPDASRKVY